MTSSADPHSSDRLLAELARAPELAPSATLHSGEQIGRFQILQEIGRGGFGVVYEARDTELGRRVAIKVLHRAADEQRLELFRREAQTVARLHHPNIVTLYDHGAAGGRPYLILERLRGETLAQRLARSPLPVDAAMDIASQIGRALEHAHAMGVIHRDLKPQNVFLTEDDQVKVLDFGLSRVRRADDSDDSPAGGGTFPYMAPEQRNATLEDERTDVFALGVVLYQLLTRRQPEEAPDLAGAPPELVGILASMLAPDPAARPATPRHALDTIASALRGPIATDPHPFRWLEAFKVEDATWFFGRDREAARLERRLAGRALIGVIGPSGAGKTSLVHAGLLPRLRRTGAWTVISMRPGARPLAQLCDRLRGGLSPAAAARLPADGAELASKPGLAGEALRAQDGRVVLIIDQLEELYTHAAPHEARLAFAAALLAAADDGARGRVRVVVTLREDFLPRVGEADDFFEVLTRDVMLLTAPADASLAEALTAPIERAGYRLESGLAEEVVAALAGERAPLPLLQLAASRLWEDRDIERRIIGRAALERAGGIAGLLAAHANEVLAGLPEAGDGALARRLLCGLVTGERTRKVVAASDLVDRAKDARAAARVLEHLVRSRLLTASRSATGEWIELAHESLLEHWSELRRWLDEDAQALAQREELAAVASYWAGHGRPRALLWSGGRLEAAIALSDRFGVADDERAFMDAARALARRRRRRRLAAQIGAPVAALAVALAALVGMRAYRAETRAAELRAAVARAGQADPLTGSLALVALSPAGEPPGGTALARRLASQPVPLYRWPGIARNRPGNISFAPDGVHFVVTDADGGVAVGRIDRPDPPVALARHDGSIRLARFSEDGRYLLTVAVDGRIVVSRADGAEPRVYQGARIMSAAASPDGRHLLVGRENGRGDIFPFEQGTIGAAVIEGLHHAKPIMAASLASGGRVAVTADLGGTIKLWRDGAAVGSWTLAGGRRGGVMAGLTRDAARVFAIAGDGGVYVWPAVAGAEPLRVGAHRGWALPAATSPDGTRFVTVSPDGTARIWRTDGTGAPVVLYGDGGRMEGADFSPDGTSVATLAGELKLWNLDNGALRSFGPVRFGGAVRFSPDGRFLAVASREAVSVFRVDGGVDPMVIGEHGRVAQALAVTRDGRRFMTGSNDGAVWIRALDGSRPGLLLAERPDMCTSAVFAPDDSLVAAGYRDGVAMIVRSGGRGPSVELRGHSASVVDLAFEPNGKHLVTASVDGTARRWGVDGSGGEIAVDARNQVTTTPAGWEWSLVLSPDAGRLAVEFPDQTVRVWSLGAPGAPAAVLRQVPASSVARFAPDGSRLAIGADDGSIRVWRIDGETILLRGHTGRVQNLRFDGHGARLVSGGRDGTARVWRVDGSGEPVVLRGHSAQVNDVRFSRDGRLVLSASDDDSARIWRSDGRGEPIVLAGHRMAIVLAMFTPDDRRVITSSMDRTERLWRYRFDDLVTFLADRTHACLTAEQRQFIGLGGLADDAACR